MLVRVGGNTLMLCCGRGVGRWGLCGDELATTCENDRSACSGPASLPRNSFHGRAYQRKAACRRLLGGVIVYTHRCLQITQMPMVGGQGEQTIVLPSEGILYSRGGERGCIVCSYTELSLTNTIRTPREDPMHSIIL